MAGRGRGPISAEQPVPPGQVEAEVAVGLARRDRMMHQVHVGVTTIRRSTRSSHDGIDTLPWLNMDVAFSTTSNTNTATGGMPSAMTTAILISMEIKISIG